MQAAKTAPSGARVPAGIRRPTADLAALVEELRALRYLPLADFERAAVSLAMRIANAEQTAYDATRVMRGAGL